MKKIILLLVFCFNGIYAQRKLEPITNFSDVSLGIITPFHFGNNSLNKDTSNNIGFTLNTTILKVYEYRLGVGFESIKYKVNDNFFGNYDYINKYSYVFKLDYEINLNEQFKLFPNIAYSICGLNYKHLDSRQAIQRGNEIRLGATIDYKLNDTFSTFIGLNYIRFHNNLNATEENKKFYGQSNSIQLSLGFKIN